MLLDSTLEKTTFGSNGGFRRGRIAAFRTVEGPVASGVHVRASTRGTLRGARAVLSAALVLIEMRLIKLKRPC